jgi:hypothetical protein
VTCIHGLPFEVWVHIAEYVTLRSIQSFALTNKHAYDASDEALEFRKTVKRLMREINFRHDELVSVISLHESTGGRSVVVRVK